MNGKNIVIENELIRVATVGNCLVRPENIHCCQIEQDQLAQQIHVVPSQRFHVAVRRHPDRGAQQRRDPVGDQRGRFVEFGGLDLDRLVVDERFQPPRQIRNRGHARTVDQQRDHANPAQAQAVFELESHQIVLAVEPLPADLDPFRSDDHEHHGGEFQRAPDLVGDRAAGIELVYVEEDIDAGRERRPQRPEEPFGHGRRIDAAIADEDVLMHRDCGRTVERRPQRTTE